MRIVVSIIGIVLLIFGIFILNEEPERTAVKPPKPTRPASTYTPSTTEAVLPKRPAKRAQLVDASLPVDVPDAMVVKDARADESGLYRFSLGTHRVKLKGETGVFLVAEILIKTPSATARENIRRLRNKLVGMYFFLVSRRVDESLMSDAGIERLQSDLLQRFSNTIRGGELSSVELLDYSIEDPEEE